MEEIKRSGLTLQQAKLFADAAMADVKNGFVSTGYYLKAIRDERLWKEQGYTSFDAFLNVNYEKDKSWASRCVSLYEKFGVEISPGELPKLNPEFMDYNVSQLIEMISLPEKKRDLITPETSVRAIREMKPKREKKVETVATSEPEEEQDREPEETQDRTAYVKEQYRLQESFLNPFAVWLIKNHKAWFMEDHMNRVIKVDKSEGQLKSYLGAYPDGSSSYGFPVDSETYYAKLYDNRIVISHFTDRGAVVVDGTAEWFYLAASIQVQWNVVALEEAQEKRGAKENHGTCEFNSDPTSCPHRNEYSCTISFENRTLPGNGSNCGSSCCWSCKFHGACKLECNASAGRDGSIPEYDAAWSVREWTKIPHGDLKRVLEVCRKNSTNAERAKAVQEKISPYGAYGYHSGLYDFQFRSFAGGIDFRIGKVEIHLKYGRFVQELMNLNPDFEEPASKEPETVPEQEESVPDSTENIIDGEYMEVTPEPMSPFAYCLEDIREETNFLKEQLKLLGDEDSSLKFARKLRMQYDAILLVKREFENYLNRQNNDPEYSEQPELPILKNNEQRAAFIDAYETWSLWIETKETGERYYRYDLSEKVAIVVKVNWKHSWASYKESKDYEYGAQQYYLVGVKSEWHNGKNAYVEDESRTFYECGTNRSALVEYLKDFQKSK